MENTNNCTCTEHEFFPEEDHWEPAHACPMHQVAGYQINEATRDQIKFEGIDTDDLPF
jgi:hypothetical protein